MQQPVLVFDIETIPDVSLMRQCMGLDDNCDDAGVLAAMRVQQGVTEDKFFPQHAYHRIVAISVVLAEHDNIKIKSLGEIDDDESELIRLFFAGIAHYQPILVSWNGSGFDLPVLHYRALKHGIAAEQYWELGDNDSRYRYNNYINRYHYRHLDIMDVLAGYQPRAAMKLDVIAKMLNLPGKITMDGSQVYPQYQQGKLNEIRQYCELDVLNTYLVYLRFEKMRGSLTEAQYEKKLEQITLHLQQTTEPHLKEYLEAWEG